MPSNKIQYVLGIQADTSQAKKSIQELQNALNEITTANSKKLGLDIDLNNAAKAAQQLQHSIQSAVNVDTGRLNFTAFNKSLMQSNTNLSQLITQLRSTGGLGNQAVSQLARSLSTAEIPIKRMTGLLGNFATTLANSFKWQISSNIIHGMQSALSSAVGYAQDLNETLNNIRIVTGQSVDDMAKFAVSANQAAKELSTTTKEFANASLIYYQQGDSAELAAKKAATTVKAANVAFTASAKEMSEMLTAVWNSYQVGEDQLERTVDIMAKLGATTASSMEEMATAMQKVASTANTVGISMEQMSAIVATSASVTRQAPQTVGTAWNTILSRIGGLKLGETLEDGVDLNKYSNALRTVGVNILDTTGNLRDMGGVIDELGAKWQTLNKGQKAALAQTIGGARQYTQIMAFFENFDKYQKNIITAQNSTGALQEQQEIYAQGWEAARDRSRAALEELWDVLIDDEAMISFTNGMTKMTESVTGLVKAFGGLPGILATVSALMARTFSNQIVTGASKAAASIVNFGQAFTKQGNGQPMSGGYTIGQFLTGRMPNAEERAQISNLAVTRDILLQTARTGTGLDQENPFYNQLRQSNGLQVGAYTAQIQAMRQGGNLTPVQMLNLANLQQRAEHTQNAYNILDAFHEDTSAVSSNLIHTNQGASNIFAGLSKAMYREELMRIQERAASAAGEELEAYKSQFADIAKKAGINDAVFGSYKPAANTSDSNSLARKFGSLEFEGLTEAERRQVIADTRQATAQSIQATRSQFNPNGQVDPASRFKAIGEAAKTAVTGITSGVAAFNQLNSAMAAFNAGNVIQGLTGIATTATSVAQAFIIGGPVAGGIAAAGAAIGLLVGQYTADVERMAEKAKEVTEKLTNDSTELQSKIQNTQTQQSLYNDLTEQLSQGIISQDEFNTSLLNVANSLGVQGANVLALSGNYKELEAQVKNTINAQLEQEEFSSQHLGWQARNATGSTLYTAFGTYGLNTTPFTKTNAKNFTVTNGFNDEYARNVLAYSGQYDGSRLQGGGIDYSFLEKTLGVKIDQGGGLTLGTDFESLTTFLSGVKTLEKEAQNYLGTNYGNALQEFLEDSSFSKLRSAVETTVAPAQAALKSELTSKGQIEANNLTASYLQGYDSQKRQDWIDQLLASKNITEEDNAEAYEIGQEVLGSLIDSTLAGMGAEGAKLSASASSAASKRASYTKQLETMGRSTAILNGLSDEQLNSSLGLGYWLSGGRSIDTTNLDAWNVSQSALEAYRNRGAGFDVMSFAQQFIFGNATLTEMSGTTLEDFKKMSADAQRKLVTQWIRNIEDASDDLQKNADNGELGQGIQDAYRSFVDDFEAVISEDLTKFDFNALSQYTQEAFLADQEKIKNGEEASKLYQQAMDLGGWKNAQYWSLRYNDTNPNISRTNTAATEKTIDQLVVDTERLSNIDLNDLSKLKEFYSDFLQTLSDKKDISLEEWLGMSDLEKRQVQLELINENITQIKEKLAEEGNGSTDELIQLEYEAQQLQIQLDTLSLNNLNRELAETNQKWEDMQNAAEKALNIISSHLGDSSNMSFVEIEQLRQNLVDAGVEIKKVDTLMNQLMNKGSDGTKDKSDVWAGVTAAGIAALQNVTAQKASAKGLYDLDIVVSKDEVQEHAEAWPKEQKVELSPGTDTVTTTITSWDLDNQTVTLTLSNGETLTKEIEGVATSGDGKTFTIYLADGTTQTITNDLGNAITAAADGNPISVTVQDGSESGTTITGTIKSWITDANGTTVTVGLDNGSTVAITNGIVTAVSIADGTTFTAKVEDGTEDGQTITGKLKQLVIDASGQTFTAKVEDGSEEGKTITGTLEELVKAANGASFTARLADGTTAKITSDLTTAVTTAKSDKSVTITYDESNGEVLTAATAPETKIIKVAYEIDANAYKQWIGTQNAAFSARGGDLGSLDALSAAEYGSNLLNGKYNSSAPIAYALRFNNQIIQNASNINFNDDAIKDTISQLWQIAQSENGELSSIGQFLIAGLKQGIADAGNSADWSTLIDSLNLGADVIQAFKDALGIASPSRLTMELGHYLIEGLQIGIDNSIASWNPKVSGLAGKLNAAFKESLGNFSGVDFIRDAMDRDPMLGYQGAEQELQNYLNTSSLDFYRSFLSGGYMRSNLSDEAKTALGNLLEESGYTAEQISQMSAEKIDKLVANLDSKWKQALTQVENNLKLTIAQMKDIWKSGLSKIFDNEEEIADKTYKKWEQTFKAIADARASLLNGNAILDDVLNDKDSIASILQYLMTNGMSFDEAKTYLKNPNADLSQLSFEAYSANAKNAAHSGANQFFGDSDKFDWNAYQANRQQWVIDNLSSADAIRSLNDVLNASPNKDSILNQLYELGSGQQASLKDLLSFDAISGDITGVKDGIMASFAEILLSTLFADNNLTGQSVLSHMAEGIGYSDKTSAEEGFYGMKAADVQAEGQANYQPWQEQAEAIGTNVKALKEYADTIAAVNGQKIDWANLTQQENQELAIHTAKVKSVEDAWKDLTSSQKSNINTVAKLGDKNKAITGEQMSALSSLTKSVKQFFGNSEKITEDFVRDNIKDIQQMVKGDEKALERLQDKLIETTLGDDYNKEIEITVDGQTATTTLGNLIDDFEDRFKNLNDGAIITPEIDTSGATGALIDLLNQGGETANGIQQALNQVGWQPQVEYEEVPISSLHTINGVAQVPVVDYTADGLIGGWHYESAPTSGDVNQDGMIKIPKIGANGQLQYSGLQKTGAGQSSGRTPSKGGGGGGGKEHKKKDPIRPKDEIERYHEIRDQIEKLGNALDRVDKLKTKTFGGKHLDALKEEIALLKQENGLQQEYYAEAARYLAADRADLMHYGAATFNADGTVNYEEYMQNIIAEVNRRFAASESDEEDKAAQQWYDDAKKALENYEEALDLVDTTQNDILDNLNEISALTLEAAQYRLEIRVDLNDSDIEILDYYIAKWEKMLSQQDESMEASIGQVYAYEDSLAALGDTFSELIYAHNTGDLNDSDFVEGLKDVRDQVFDTLGSINDLQNTIAEWYGQTLDKAEEELDKYTNKISHSRDVMQTYIEMQQLMGKGADYRALSNMYTFAYESSLENAKAAREYVDILKEAREVILQQVEEYGWTDTLKQQFDDVEEHIIEAENTLLENTQQTLEDAKAEFENTMSAIIKEVDNVFTALKDANGDLKKSFSEVADEYSFWTEQQGWYVSTAKELYEVSKINRKIEDSIAGATTQQSKERLKLLQDEINAYAEKNRLTEYDIKMNELQYEMALAMQGLEDAGNNKQTVRLTRDENGNYGYQYTADQDEMDAARQKYEDVLQQINELSDEYQKEVAQKWIDAEQQFWEKVQEISQDTTLTVEERQRRIEELTAQHLETMQYYHDEYNKASEQLLTNQGYIQEHYGETIMANTGMVQDQLNATISMMIGDTERYMTHITEEALPAISDAMEIYKGDLDATKEATNLSWEQMGDSVQAYRGINQLARQDIQNTDQVLRNTLSGISNATAKWLEHSNSLRTTITSYESLGNSINGIISKLNGVTSAANTAASAIRNMQSASYSSYSGGGGSGNSGGSGSGSGSGGAKSPAGTTVTVTTSKPAASQLFINRQSTNVSSWTTKSRSSSYSSGRYTMSTGGLDDVTGWHYLHGTLQRPELVLNADDTQNMLKMVNILHNLSPEMLSALHGTINGSAYTMLAGLGAMSAHSINSTNSELNQNVEIHADFPNVTDKNEIVEAFDNLVNLATQYANRKG